MDSLLYYSATELLESIRTQSVSIEDVVLNLYRRLEEINGHINAIVHSNKENALTRAREMDKNPSSKKTMPLYGLPITIKDNIDTKGLVTTGGIHGREKYIPKFDSPVVDRLKKAGAIIVGKTNCPAYCAGWETENQLFGRTNNPYDLERTVGSSSGGEAALVAAGGSYLGIGSDTGGSIRWPASFCGVAGLVPTFGRVPRTGTIPPYLGFLDTTQIGPIARNVEDLSLVLSVMSGPDFFDTKCMPMIESDSTEVSLDDLKIAYYAANGFVTPEPAIERAVIDGAEALSQRGVEIDEKCPSVTEEFLTLSQGLNGFAKNIEPKTAPSTSELEQPSELYPEGIHSLVERMANQAEESRPISGKQAMLAIEFFYRGMKWDSYRSRLMQFMKEYDAILCPVSAIPAFSHGASNLDSFEPLSLLSYTHPYSFAGLPSVTLRTGTSSKGLPIGIQILTRPCEEGLALKLALAIEDKLGGWQPPPI